MVYNCGDCSISSKNVESFVVFCFGLAVYVSADLCLRHIQPRAPCDFYHPYDFLPVRPSEAAVGILCRCCSRDHIRLRTPCVLTRLYRAGPARESSIFFISYRTRTGPVRNPQGCRAAPLRTRKGIGKTKNPARASSLVVRGPYGPLTAPARAVHGLFKIPIPVRGP